MTPVQVCLKKEVPNMLTLLRVVLACFLNLYIINRFGNILLPGVVYIAIFITDFLDGRVARFYGTVSRFGAVFDVFADLFYIVSSYIILIYYNILPLWFLFIVIFKFMEFVATSFFLKKLHREKSIFVFDFIGRICAVLFYVIPAFEYTSFLYSQYIYFFTTHIFLYIITCMVFLSSAYRLWNCIRVSRSLPNINM